MTSIFGRGWQGGGAVKTGEASDVEEGSAFLEKNEKVEEGRWMEGEPPFPILAEIFKEEVMVEVGCKCKIEIST